MLGTDPVLPLAIAELLLFGLLGPDPGALLQREETGGAADSDRVGGIIHQTGYKRECFIRHFLTFSVCVHLISLLLAF